MEQQVKVGQVFRNTVIKSIKQEFDRNNCTFLLTFASLSSSQMDDLRKGMSKIGAKVFVAKNRVAKIALKDLKQEPFAQKISGQTAFVWSSEDAVSISKALIDFSKKWEGLTIKAGLLDGAILEAADVKRLSELPAKEVLQSQLLAVIIAPVTRFAGLLNAKTRDLLSIMKQLSENKEEGSK